MVCVMASGVFDIIHLGHVRYLSAAKDLGDTLVVVVATDNTVRKLKHEPITNEAMRRELIANLKPVDHAVLGHDGDRYRIVEELRPDIIAIGYDQGYDPDRLVRDCAARGVDLRVERLPKFDYDLDGTRKIVNKIIEWYRIKKMLAKVEGKSATFKELLGTAHELKLPDEEGER